MRELVGWYWQIGWGTTDSRKPKNPKVGVFWRMSTQTLVENSKADATIPSCYREYMCDIQGRYNNKSREIRDYNRAVRK